MQRPTTRLTYIDGMRGLACLLMFEIHGFDAWLSPVERSTAYFRWAQVLGGFAAPAFLFLAGVSQALLSDKLLDRGERPSAIARTTATRGASILGVGLLFRLVAVLLGWGKVPWTDLFRVDILNTLGVSMMALSVVYWGVSRVAPSRHIVTRVAVPAVISLAIAMLTPPLHTTWRLRWLPWWLESYINGVHNLDSPQSWAFGFFPWAAFAFAGLAVGCGLAHAIRQERHDRILIGVALAGGALIAASMYLDRQSWTPYATYDYWRTSPNYFLVRLGILLIALAASALWSRRPRRPERFSPMVSLGRHSLLVYLAHMPFVYGGLSILEKGESSTAQSTLGVVGISLAMIGLCAGRDRWKTRGKNR